MRRFWCALLIGVCVISSLHTNTMAFAVDAPLQDEVNMIARATAPFNVTIAAHKASKADTAFSLAAGETVTIRATYEPASSSLKVGLIDEEGTFQYVTVTGGSINKTIQVSANGYYIFGIKNESNAEVKVSGFVNY